MPVDPTPVFEFHISRQARDRYKFDELIFGMTGNVIFANFHGARLFASKMNQGRDVINFPERAVRSSQINAMGLIDEILHMVVQEYRQQINPKVMQEALDWLGGMLGKEDVDATLLQFVHEFPPQAVHRREMNAQDYLSSEIGGMSARQIALEEILLLWVANENPAFSPFQELFDDSHLEKETAYGKLIPLMRAFLKPSHPLVRIIRTWWICCAVQPLTRHTPLLPSLNSSASDGEQSWGNIYIAF
jgi:hypothetical protein